MKKKYYHLCDEVLFLAARTISHLLAFSSAIILWFTPIQRYRWCVDSAHPVVVISWPKRNRKQRMGDWMMHDGEKTGRKIDKKFINKSKNDEMLEQKTGEQYMFVAPNFTILNFFLFFFFGHPLLFLFVRLPSFLSQSNSNNLNFTKVCIYCYVAILHSKNKR